MPWFPPFWALGRTAYVMCCTLSLPVVRHSSKRLLSSERVVDGSHGLPHADSNGFNNCRKALRLDACRSTRTHSIGRPTSVFGTFLYPALYTNLRLIWSLHRSFLSKLTSKTIGKCPTRFPFWKALDTAKSAIMLSFLVVAIKLDSIDKMGVVTPNPRLVQHSSRRAFRFHLCPSFIALICWIKKQQKQGDVSMLFSLMDQGQVCSSSAGSTKGTTKDHATTNSHVQNIQSTTTRLILRLNFFSESLSEILMQQVNIYRLQYYLGGCQTALIFPHKFAKQDSLACLKFSLRCFVTSTSNKKAFTIHVREGNQIQNEFSLKFEIKKDW